MTGDRFGRPSVLRRPRQGWSSLGLLLGLLLLLGASVAASRPLPIGSADPSSSLPALMLAAVLIGFLLARSGIGLLRAHVLGAAAAAVLLLLVAAAAVEQRGDPLILDREQLFASLAALSEAIQEAIAGYARSIDTGDAANAASPSVVTFLVLGAILWATAQFSAFAVFRYDRGGPAVMAVGVVLFLNIGLGTQSDLATPLPTLPQLVVFSVLAMLLLVRLQLTQQGYQWARRHIADTGEVERLFMRSGTLFVALTVAGASTLSVAANVGEQQLPDIGGIEATLEDIGEQIAPLLPFLGVSVQGDGPRSINDSFEVASSWERLGGTAFRARLDGGPAGAYWWLHAASEFDGWTWRNPTVERARVEGGDPIVMSPELGGPWNRVDASVSIEDLPFDRTVVSPAELVRVSDAAVTLERAGADDVVTARFQRDEPVESYFVTARVRDYESLTAYELDQAGRSYPPEIRERYLQGTGRDSAASGRRTIAKAREIEQRFDDPYDQALEIQNQLRDMRYREDMGTLCTDGGLNVPECVLEHRQGFCQYYASTMVMVMREMGVPARIVRGFLPGRDAGDGVWTVPNAAYHAWVEVYFPDYGWVRFDPTPGTVQSELGLAQTELEPGGPEPTGGADEPDDPGGVPDAGDVEEEVAPEPTPLVGAEPGCTGDCGDDDGVLAAIIVGGGLAGLLLITAAGLLLLRFRRLSEADGGVAFGGIVSLATRLGLGPHPAQTEYEYAGTLADAIPAVRDDLYLVAETRVQTAYGRRPLDDARRALLRRAYARIRTALLRLSLRRRG